MTSIEYTSSTNRIEHTQLQGFFVDWPSHPSSERFLEILRASHGVELAIDSDTNQVVGFIQLEVFPTLWDEANPCLLLIKTLEVLEIV
jgi:hypothetical protein